MTFATIFEESMKAMAQGDRARMEELVKIQEQKIAKLRKNKNVQEQRTQKGFPGR